MKFNFKKTYYRVFSLVLAIVMFMISLPLAALAINDTSSSEFEENIVHITEITDRREENVKHFDMGDGTYTAISYGTAVHRKDENGEWRDINNNLSLTTVQSKERYATSDMRTSFAKQFTPNAQLVTLAENGYSISMGILQSASKGSINADDTAQYVPSAPSKITNALERASAWTDIDDAAIVDNTSSIVYNNIKSGVDLEYILDGSDIKENIIVKSRQSSYVYDFQLILSGLVAILNDDGSISLLDVDDGTAKYTIPAPYMYDANGEISYSVTYSLLEVKPELYILTVDANDEWINDAERAFPVIVDPTIHINNNTEELIEDTSIHQNLNRTNGSTVNLLVSSIDTAFFRFQLPDLLPLAQFEKAELRLHYYYSTLNDAQNIELSVMRVEEERQTVGAVVNRWDADTLNGEMLIELCSPNTVTLDADANATSDTPYLYFFDITNLVDLWLSGEKENNGLAIKRTGGDISRIFFKSSEAPRVLHRPYVVIQYSDVADGVYMLKNATRNLYVDARYDAYTPSITMQQTYFSNNTSQTTLEKSAMFKISKNSDGKYIIRLMTNNLLSFETTNGSDVLTKLIPADDNDVETVDTYTIQYNMLLGGYTIKSNDSSRFISSKDSWDNGDTGGDNARLIHVQSTELTERAAWELIPYDGEEFSDIGLNFNSEVKVGNYVHMFATASSTKINSNQAQATFLNVPADSYTSIYCSPCGDEQYFWPHKSGTWSLHLSYVNGEEDDYDEIISVFIDSPIPEGKYLIKNRGTGEHAYAPNYSGQTVCQYTLAEDTLSVWELSHVYDGYFTIKMYDSDLYLTAPVGNEYYNNFYYVSQLSEELTDKQLWKISDFEDVLISKYYESSNMVAGVYYPAEGVSLTNCSYVDDSNLNDEWKFVRLLPTSGYELEYEPDLWNGDYIANNNCYSYAINNYVENLEYICPDPGESSGATSYILGLPESDDILEGAIEDFKDHFGNQVNAFIPIGRYEVCPEGMYKVALVIAPGSDYHWYRQDPDGLWSHKLSSFEVSRLDGENRDGNLIIDPQICDRAGYTEFMGYFAILPWKVNISTNE